MDKILLRNFYTTLMSNEQEHLEETKLEEDKKIKYSWPVGGSNP